MLDIEIEDMRWQELALETLAHEAVSAALAHVQLDLDDCEVVILACDDARIAELNEEFREKAKATNVLSWPSEDLAAETPGADPERPEADFTGEIALGDIAIAYDTCAREAEEAGKSMTDHVRHLVVHGTLHLLGYDHIRDEDATLMETLEVEILGKLGIPNPYEH
ncbi:rRNA maturation RNase YbeY [Epibacterium sp. SM1979]|uniref:Endoribonuclease YbeY n=1 Tax=Tritonibacter litoralis TaxID=2662264 RepID=A0A843YDX1_9RHOB|nr:rRNA maturation RNase YbeY [Tritonibacter litoralis]MQQ09256.1 rRNA maturation RNase YbeY [Tritonibacter litoralis]